MGSLSPVDQTRIMQFIQMKVFEQLGIKLICVKYFLNSLLLMNYVPWFVNQYYLAYQKYKKILVLNI